MDFTKTISRAICLGAVLITASASAERLTHEGSYLRLEATGGALGTMPVLGPAGSDRNFAAGRGLLQEGFGVGSYYVPNRRVNERMEELEGTGGGPVWRYTYDCQGPNINGLHVRRDVEPIAGEASVRVHWRVEHRGDEELWVAPWVRQDVAPGGSYTDAARLNVPALRRGVINPNQSGYFAAARNWMAATNPETNETIYGVFDAEQTLAFLAIRDDSNELLGMQAAFAPGLLEPGDVWETTYRINTVRGLSRIDFASDEVAVQLDYDGGELQMLLATARPMPPAIVEATIMDDNGESWRLPNMRLPGALRPDQMARVRYEWEAPHDGDFDFLARFTNDGQPRMLGEDTRSPHGGIDTRFRAGGGPAQDLEAWTTAPYSLNRGERTLRRDLAVSNGGMAVWFEPALSKIYPEDKVVGTGERGDRVRVRMARNESQSFQVVMRPPEDEPLRNVGVSVHGLRHEDGEAAIGAEHISIRNVAFHDVRIPSHFEGPTGKWPDALPTHDRFNAPGGQCSAVWITVRTPPDIPSGTYQGMIEILASDHAPIELWAEVEVFDFTLPRTPSLRTDFRYWAGRAREMAREQGYTGSPEALDAAHRDLALQHRITLRELTSLPAESPDYEASLREFEAALEALREKGASAFFVPDSLLEVPEQLRAANAFVREHDLSSRVFAHLGDEPGPPSWPRVYERVQQWQEAAPDIPVMVTTFGMQPFLPERVDIWGVHMPMLDTANNRPILERTAEGGRVWAYVNHAPPRPYGNLFTDFQAIEHRILFWQMWALGFEGFHYWGANYAAPGQNPWEEHVDITPVNGDGLLIYPGADGPVPSIRLKTVRDGVQDYEYLVMLSDRIRALRRQGGAESLLERANEARNLQALMPNLIEFSRDPERLEERRVRIARMIEELDRELGR